MEGKDQSKIDEEMKQIELNQQYMNDIKKEIEENTPFITELLDIGVLVVEFKENKFESCFEELQKRYKNIRRLRRDGNCFYRAFLY